MLTKTFKNLPNFDQTGEKLRSISVPFLSVKQVAELLGSDKKSVSGWCQKRLLMAEEIPYGSTTTFRIPPHAVILFLESQKTLAETTKKQMDNHSPFVPGWIEAMKKGMIPGKKGSYSTHTLSNYILRINKFLQLHPAVTYQSVKESLQTFEDRSSNKVQQYRALNSFTRYLFGENALDEVNYGKITGKDIRPQGNPTPRRLRVPYEDYRTMILKGCGSPQDKAIVHILYHTGMRASEFCGIQLEHIHLEKRELFIPQGEVPQATAVRAEQSRLRGVLELSEASFQTGRRIPVSG
jgi:integrase